MVLTSTASSAPDTLRVSVQNILAALRRYFLGRTDGLGYCLHSPILRNLSLGPALGKGFHGAVYKTFIELGQDWMVIARKKMQAPQWVGLRKRKDVTKHHPFHTVNTVDLPIALFDSGVGGLTVASAMRRRLPSERLVYLGDTARLPYGTKSPETVVRYALKAASLLADRGMKMLVVACNTASSHALPALADALPGVPILGVVEAGADEAARVSREGRIVVAATEGTCRSRAFEAAILSRRPDAQVVSVPCAVMVALAEEGMTEGAIARAVAAHYLESHFTGPDAGDCLVLGCTHFPLLRKVMAEAAGPGAILVDCADAVAEMAARVLAERGLGRPAGAGGGLDLLATDAPDRFVRLADRLFPGLRGDAGVEQVDL